MTSLRALGARRHVGPTSVALLLALVSLPLVALTLPVVVPPPDPSTLAPAAPPLDPSRWLAAIGSVVAGALVGGSVGGWLVRRNGVVGTLAAIVLAWHVGLFALPVLPAASGLEFRAGSYCVDFCHIAIEGGATSAIEIYLPLGWFFAPIVGWGPLVTLILGVVIWYRAIRPISPTTRVTARDGWQSAPR